MLWKCNVMLNIRNERKIEYDVESKARQYS